MILDVKEISKGNISSCISLFIEVFNSEPWNDQWTLDKAKKLFLDFFDTPGFIGYLGFVEEDICSVCIGHIKTWWDSMEYCIEEFYVDPKMQGKGIGTSFLKDIEKRLLQKDIHKITLMTARNTMAERFYIKQGFNRLDVMTYMKKDI